MADRGPGQGALTRGVCGKDGEERNDGGARVERKGSEDGRRGQGAGVEREGSEGGRRGRQRERPPGKGTSSQRPNGTDPTRRGTPIGPERIDRKPADGTLSRLHLHRRLHRRLPCRHPSATLRHPRRLSPPPRPPLPALSSLPPSRSAPSSLAPIVRLPLPPADVRATEFHKTRALARHASTAFQAPVPPSPPAPARTEVRAAAPGAAGARRARSIEPGGAASRPSRPQIHVAPARSRRCGFATKRRDPARRGDAGGAGERRARGRARGEAPGELGRRARAPPCRAGAPGRARGRPPPGRPRRARSGSPGRPRLPERPRAREARAAPTLRWPISRRPPTPGARSLRWASSSGAECCSCVFRAGWHRGGEGGGGRAGRWSGRAREEGGSEGAGSAAIAGAASPRAHRPALGRSRRARRRVARRPRRDAGAATRCERARGAAEGARGRRSERRARARRRGERGAAEGALGAEPEFWASPGRRATGGLLRAATARSAPPPAASPRFCVPSALPLPERLQTLTLAAPSPCARRPTFSSPRSSSPSPPPSSPPSMT